MENISIEKRILFFPCISSDWSLKRSGDWCVLQKFDIEDSDHCRLTPLVAATIALFDGTKTLLEIISIVSYSHNITNPLMAWRFVQNTIEQINAICIGAITLSKEKKANSRQYNFLDFIVCPKKNANQKRLFSPISIGLMFSNQCQTDCVYCYAERRTIKKDQHLSIDRWRYLFNEIDSMGIDVVGLSGGDPLFRKDSIDLIESLVSHNKLFLISTKCHITDAMAKRLSSSGFNVPINEHSREIQISLDSTDEATADYLAGSKGYFKRAEDSINNLQRYGFSYNVKVVVTPFNVKQLIHYVDFMANKGVNRIRFVAYSRSFYNHSDHLFLSNDDSKIYGEQIHSIRESHPEMDIICDGKFTVQDTNTSSEDKLQSWRNRASCSGGRTSLTITPNGNVILCDQIPHDSKFIVGNVCEKSIQEVWESKKLLEFVYPHRDKFKGTPCFDCKGSFECYEVGGERGYCFRDSFFIYGNQFSPPPSCPNAPDSGPRMA